MELGVLHRALTGELNPLGGEDELLGEEPSIGLEAPPGHALGRAGSVVAVDDRDRGFGVDGFGVEVEPFLRPRAEVVFSLSTKGARMSSA